MSTPFSSARPNRKRRPSAARWSALSASGLVLCAAVVLADDDSSPTSASAAASTDAPAQVSPGTAGQQTKTQIDMLQAALNAAETQKARLTLQLELLNRKQTDLEAQAVELDRLRQQLRQSQTAAERTEAQAEALRAEIQQLGHQRELEAQKHIAQLTASELRLREHKDRLMGVDARIQGLEQRLAQREAQIARMEAADARRAEAKQQLEDRIAELRARLPAPEGGTLTVVQAQAQARRDAETLERLIREGQGVQNPQLWQQIQETENALHRSQYLLARAEGDRTVYRARPGDSLARISALFYGDDHAWTRIFEANRHLLDDPDTVPPGLTLVIP